MQADAGWRGGELQHHLIDPRTGTPADSPWEQVTVSGDTCLAADVAAKAAFLLGYDGPDWLDRTRPARPILVRRWGHRRHAQLERGGGGRVHLTTSSVDWYAARAAGVVAYVVLTLVVVARA